MTPLIVFSHLRWNFVYQRPQHLMTRLAKYYDVYFVEEPIHDPDGEARWVMSEPAPNVRVCQPHTKADAGGFHDEQLAELSPLLKTLLTDNGLRDPIVWLYTPMALPLIGSCEARLIVYDCMDELAAFKDAPRQLLQREHALMKVADLVFTGGQSLYRAKLPRHRSVHCFPSSVEREHFALARQAPDHPEQAALPHPRLGFFGVIDERFDVPLLARMAKAHPEWQIVMVGPIVKIDADSLPRQPNIHYMGSRKYGELPNFLAGWDVCLLPFALNEATRFISPTKTLEYMAAEKPIVSTAVEDVVAAHRNVVRIGEGDGFIRQCEAALREPAAARELRASMMRQTVQSTSWDSTAEQMRTVMEECAAAGPIVDDGGGSLPLVPPGNGAASRPAAVVRKTPVLIVGAGPTGLSAAYHLGEESLLIEREQTVGGWCRSFVEGGFTFDYAGHIMFSNDPYVQQLYRVLLGDNVHWQDREAWVYSKDVYTRYPFQGALYGLPSPVVAECIVGAIEARVGPLKDMGGAKGAAGLSAGGSSPTAAKPDSITDCCADGMQESTAPLGPKRDGAPAATAPRNFEEFIYQVWGRGIAKHFAVPYNRKLWAVPLSAMETSWLGGRVPMPDLQEMIEGALSPVARPMGPNARFGYPLRGGFQALMDGFLPHLRGDLLLDTQVARVFPSQHKVALADGSVVRYDQLISTMPLPALVRLSGGDAPVAVRQAAARLRHVSVRCVNLGIARAAITEKHWVYYPEASVFHRIFVQGNASPHCNVPDGFALTCEITYSPDKPLPCDGEALIDRCIEDCVAVGMIRANDRILVRNQIDMPYAYVVYDHERAANVTLIREWAKSHDIILSGRYSEWEYYNSDHAFLAGRKAADEAMRVLRLRKPSSSARPAIASATEYLRASP